MLLSDECPIEKNLISQEILDDKFKRLITVKAVPLRQIKKCSVCTRWSHTDMSFRKGEVSSIGRYWKPVIYIFELQTQLN